MILLIDTATEQASIAIASDGKALISDGTPQSRDQATWLHPAVERMLASAGLSFNDLQAVAVSAGPGSYTGLRVGMSAAKGFCFALNIPLITVNSLEIMAGAMVPAALEKKAMICPMIDARREEVFTAVYSSSMQEIMAPQALILDKTSFEEYFSMGSIIFSGSGSEKWEKITTANNALFISQMNVIESFAKIASQLFAKKAWASLDKAEPIYLKEFYTHAKK